MILILTLARSQLEKYQPPPQTPFYTRLRVYNYYIIHLIKSIKWENPPIWLRNVYGMK